MKIDESIIEINNVVQGSKDIFISLLTLFSKLVLIV